MKTLLLAGLAASALTLGSLTPAAAEGGCGPFAHRSWDGFCRPNHRPYPAYGFGERAWGGGERHRDWDRGGWRHGDGDGDRWRHRGEDRED